MTLENLRDILLNMVQGYFAGASVMWGEQNNVRPSSPFIRLKLGSISRPQHLLLKTGNAVPCGYILSTTIFSVELFTHGRKMTDEDGDSYFINTAMDDLSDFVSYMLSPYADDVYERHNISLRTEGDILDTSAVLDSDYEYRAMQEFAVEFMQEARGYAGISHDNWEPTPSGGGTADLASKEISDIDCRSIEIKETEEVSQ